MGKSGKVTYENGKYFGIYHENLVKGIYNPKTNSVVNLVRDPSRYFNICVGVIDYLFSKRLLQANIYRVHAACVSKGRKAILICGTEGKGKTTLLMKFLRSGFKFIGDDSIYLQFKKNQLICYPFPRSIKINHQDPKKFPKLYKNLKLSTISTSDGTQKVICNPQENNFPIRTQELPVSQIIVPSISNILISGSNDITPPISSARLCVVDVVKKNLSFDLLIPSFLGKGLLNIDYIDDPKIREKQESLCRKTIQIYKICIFNIGEDFRDINILNYFP
jgi:hypothetical protein